VSVLGLAPARATVTENLNLQILPAPGGVKVDGACDDQKLYVAWEVKDPTPWVNGVDGPPRNARRSSAPAWSRATGWTASSCWKTPT